MAQKRKNHSQEFKAKVALEAVKGVHTLSELASRYKIHPTQLPAAPGRNQGASLFGPIRVAKGCLQVVGRTVLGHRAVDCGAADSGGRWQ